MPLWQWLCRAKAGGRQGRCGVVVAVAVSWAVRCAAVAAVAVSSKGRRSPGAVRCRCDDGCVERRRAVAKAGAVSLWQWLCREKATVPAGGAVPL